MNPAQKPSTRSQHTAPNQPRHSNNQPRPPATRGASWSAVAEKPAATGFGDTAFAGVVDHRSIADSLNLSSARPRSSVGRLQSARAVWRCSASHRTPGRCRASSDQRPSPGTQELRKVSWSHPGKLHSCFLESSQSHPTRVRISLSERGWHSNPPSHRAREPMPPTPMPGAAYGLRRLVTAFASGGLPTAEDHRPLPCGPRNRSPRTHATPRSYALNAERRTLNAER